MEITLHQTHSAKLSPLLLPPPPAASFLARRSHIGIRKSTMKMAPRLAKKLEENDFAFLSKKNAEKEREEDQLVKEMEGLEEDAIMGDDSEEREATDYNRRARIFDTCSKVFQGEFKEEEVEELSTVIHSIPFPFVDY